MLGDFNINEENTENLIENEYCDVWKELYNIQENPGFTMKATAKNKAWRPDRIYFKKSNWIKPVKISQIGTEPISKYLDPIIKMNNPPESLIMTPSDHIGLLAEFEIV